MNYETKKGSDYGLFFFLYASHKRISDLMDSNESGYYNNKNAKACWGAINILRFFYPFRAAQITHFTQGALLEWWMQGFWYSDQDLTQTTHGWFAPVKGSTCLGKLKWFDNMIQRFCCEGNQVWLTVKWLVKSKTGEKDDQTLEAPTN